jgi:hypothetical protein
MDGYRMMIIFRLFIFNQYVVKTTSIASLLRLNFDNTLSFLFGIILSSSKFLIPPCVVQFLRLSIMK